MTVPLGSSSTAPNQTHLPGLVCRPVISSVLLSRSAGPCYGAGALYPQFGSGGYSMAKKSRPAGMGNGRRDASTGKRGPTAKKDRRYLIAPDLGELCLRSPYAHYVTGTTSYGEQGIIINGAPLFHAYWFDREGKYLRQESREVSGWSMDKPVEELIQDRLSSLQAWVKE